MSNTDCTLLVVDEEPEIQTELAELLAHEFQVVTADTAEAARAIFACREIDVILADLTLPDQTGAELLEWVREHSPQTIRLMMTGLADLETTVQAINRGQVYRIILKPWRTDELLLIMQSAAHAYWLERSHAQLLEDLRRLNGELEERVQLRTNELELAVFQLQQRSSMLEKLSLTDPLTGLPNRRAMDRVAEAELCRRSRHPSALALGLIDADHFKDINSAYLLPGGDQVLIGLGQALAGAVRREDTLGRVGGEEFQVVAPETNEAGANILAERLRSVVERKPILYKEQPIQVTVSVGFAVAEAPTPTSYTLLKQVAAAALQEAKASGRNRWVIRPTG